MDAENFEVTLLTPDAVKLEVEATEIRGVNPSGIFALQPGHTPLLSRLSVAPVEISEAGGPTHNLAVTGGFIQVRDSNVLILARTAETPEEIDVARAEAARERAEKRLVPGGEQAEVDFARARSSLARALIRLDIAGALS